MYDTYMKNSSARKVRTFWHILQDDTIPHKETNHRIVNKLSHTGSLLGKRKEKVKTPNAQRREIGLNQCLA